jgi:membrane associated rhomboid family serine protease
MFVLVGAYLLQRRFGGVESNIEDIRLGANVSGMVLAGDWWRLTTANFLHGPWFHIGANLWGLWVLGPVLERLMDGRRLLLLYLTSAFAGAAASAVFSQAMLGVGASTAIFGLLGGFAVLHFKPGVGLPSVFRQSTLWWLVILGLNGYISFVIPVVDGPAHVGGFIGGVAVTWAITGPRRPLLRVATDRLITGLTLAVLGVFALGFGQAVLSGQGFFEGTQGARLAVALANGQPAQAVNDLSWQIATDDRAGASAIKAAVAGAQRANALEPNEPAYLDTLAYTLFRSGDLVGAVRTETEALINGGQGFYALQLCTFAAHSAQAMEGTRLEALPAGQRVRARGDTGVIIARVERNGTPMGCWVGHLGAAPQQALIRDRRGVGLLEGVALVPLYRLEAAPEALPEGRWIWSPFGDSGDKVPYEVVGAITPAP